MDVDNFSPLYITHQMNSQDQSLKFLTHIQQLGFSSLVGKYELSRTIGEGTFAKVKLAVNTLNGQYAAIKITDKQMVVKNNLIDQVSREIRTTKLLRHPNIVRIYEVIGTKTKIYIVMEHVSGGQLSDKLSFLKSLSESDARKYFQQLIEDVDHCHSRGVYHRDLKLATFNNGSVSTTSLSSPPENLLLDSKGNLKVSDFGLSALNRKPESLLSTACGSPSYVAPELLSNEGYDGAAADIWSCGVILFQLLSGYLPFNDSNLTNLYKKLCRLLDPNPSTRATVPDIISHKWFQMEYEQDQQIELEEGINLDDIHEAFSWMKATETETEVTIPRSPSFINAFQLIAMSHDLDLSRLLEEKGNGRQKIKLGSRGTISETIEKIEAAAKDVSLSVERMNSTKMKMHLSKMTSSRSCLGLSAQVIEVAPKHCVVLVSRSTGELRLYKEFCRSLSSLLTEELEFTSRDSRQREDQEPN